MAVKVLGILGSPRRGGNTEILLEHALAGARSRDAETEKLILNELDITPCQSCDKCMETGECATDDDMSLVYPKLGAADCFILASPIFFCSLTAQAKLMIDRCQGIWVAKYVLGHQATKRRRRGLFISTAAGDSSEFQAAIPVVRALFTTLDVSYDGALLFSGIDIKGDIVHHPTACQDAFTAGSRLVTAI